jgi:hypothetical protein
MKLFLKVAMVVVALSPVVFLTAQAFERNVTFEMFTNVG